MITHEVVKYDGNTHTESYIGMESTSILYVWTIASTLNRRFNAEGLSYTIRTFLYE